MSCWDLQEPSGSGFTDRELKTTTETTLKTSVVWWSNRNRRKSHPIVVQQSHIRTHGVECKERGGDRRKRKGVELVREKLFLY